MNNVEHSWCISRNKFSFYSLGALIDLQPLFSRAGFGKDETRRLTSNIIGSVTGTEINDIFAKLMFVLLPKTVER